MIALARLRFVAALLLSTLVGVVRAAEAPAAAPDFDHAARTAYQQQLIDQATALGLAQSTTWLGLLHFQPRWMGAPQSQVDGRDFFLSANGKHDPAAELAATLVAFFSPARLPPNQQIAACRFAARFRFLDEALHFDPAQLPTPDCPQIRALREGVQAEGLTLIFPAGQPNNPSSMFGHTLMRVDKRGQTASTRMLSQAVNYAAAATDHGVTYLMKGLFGGYPGRFDINPYYYKLREYSDLDSRDIWEYHLRLTPAQVDFILLHVYELAPTYFDYYFFDENCSYHLLALIGVAVPEKHLVEQLPHAWVIPADVIRTLDDAGLIDAVRYEPSFRARIQARRHAMSAEERALANTLAKDDGTLQSPALLALSPARQAAVLDLAYDTLKAGRTQASKQLDTKLTDSERAVLKARAQIALPSEAVLVPTPAVRPEQGHRTGRVLLGGGVLGDRPFAEVGWRGGYHGLFDPAGGYRPFSNLEIGNLLLRRYGSPDAWKIQQLDFASILSLEPNDPFFRTVSWRLKAGLDTVITSREGTGSVVDLKSGWGKTFALDDAARTVVYGMGDLTADFGPALHDGYRIAPQLSAGLLSRFTPQWRGGLTLTVLKGVAGEQRAQGEVSLEQNWALARDFSLDLAARRIRATNGETTSEIGLQLRHYF